MWRRKIANEVGLLENTPELSISEVMASLSTQDAETLYEMVGGRLRLFNAATQGGEPSASVDNPMSTNLENQIDKRLAKVGIEISGDNSERIEDYRNLHTALSERLEITEKSGQSAIDGSANPDVLPFKITEI